MPIRPDNPFSPDLPPIIENVPAVVFRLSHKEDNWRTWYVSKNISQFGYTVEDFMSDRVRWFDLVHPDDKVLLSKTVSDYEAHGINSFKLNYRLITKNGDSVSITEYNTVNRDKDGNILCYDAVIIGNAQDEFSRRLIDSHYRQQAVLTDILMSLHDSDLEHALQIILDRTGAYLDTSRALVFKDSPDHKTCKVVYEWCNKDITSVMALDNRVDYDESMPEIYHALRSTGSLIVNFGEIPENCREEFEAEGLIASAIFAVYLNGDHYGFVCFDDCVVERTWDEDTVQFLKNISNIISSVLARQDAAQKLVQNQRTYEAVLDNIDAYIFVTMPGTHTIQFANRAFKDAFGQDCVGKLADACLPCARQAALKALEAMESGKAPLSKDGDYPEFYCHKTEEWLAFSVESITWIDGNIAHLCTCYDITAKKRFATTLEQKIEERTAELVRMTEEAEKAQKRAEDATLAKSQFLANMSHEIRTPMNAIFALSELLAQTVRDDSQLEHVRNIRRSSTILLNIINDILDISKLEAGRLALVNVDFNLLQTVDQVSSLVRGLAQSKGLEYRLTATSDLAVCLYGDDIRLRQILINILSNAVKFTEKGYVELRVELDDDWLRFFITDTGSGIAEKDLGSIFEPFMQSDVHKNRNIEGTGLGLPICKNLMDLMGGTIDVESEYGKGSMFTVTIPRVPGDDNCLEREETMPQQRFCAPEATALVVDDIDINLYVAEAVLREYGITCLLANSGAKAIELLRNNRVDIIFMDHMMPDMDGLESAKAIRALGPEYAAIPIVVLTANVVNDARQLFENSGMDDFLAKPIEGDKLATILERWLPAWMIQHGKRREP